MSVCRPLMALFLMPAMVAAAQQKDTMVLTLNETTMLSHHRSLDYREAISQYRFSYWTYRNFKTQFLPKVALTATIPGYSRSVSQIILPDGKGSFVTQNQASSNVSLNVSQQVGLTGGNFSFSSNLNRLDNFSQGHYINYSAAPFSFSYNQSLLFYNTVRVEKKIQALTMQSAEKATIESMEEISLSAVSLYFDLLTAENEYNNAITDKENADTLLHYAQTAYEVGKISQTDLLSTQLNFYQREDQVLQQEEGVVAARQQFNTFLNQDVHTPVKLLIPEPLAGMKVDISLAHEKAMRNKNLLIEIEKKNLENKEQLMNVKSQNGVSVGLNSSVGYSRVAPDLKSAYTDMNNQLNFSVSLNIPIISWGALKTAVRKIRENMSLDSLRNKKQLDDFDNDLYIKVYQWNHVLQHLTVSKISMHLSALKYEAAKEEFMLGKINFEQYAAAQKSKNDNNDQYLLDLKSYWTDYYQLRKLTLYDFYEGHDISLNLNLLVND